MPSCWIVLASIVITELKNFGVFQLGATVDYAHFDGRSRYHKESWYEESVMKRQIDIAHKTSIMSIMDMWYVFCLLSTVGSYNVVKY